MRKKCIIVDIDGTIANKKDRNPYNLDKVYDDDVKSGVLDIVKTYMHHRPEVGIVVVSGRDTICRPQTEAWLRNKAGIVYDYWKTTTYHGVCVFELHSVFQRTPLLLYSCVYCS
jgi:hypothetical protein